ncbi:MAG: DNA mismatch repair protein [Clostridiales bacterium]|nr:DNA mismatch repair protein [Clostridiales bacterium]MBQ2156219.1 DNA mismatch repair protein [Clostridiales bacterium]
MVGDKKFSLLYPRGKTYEFTKIEDDAFHDLGLDVITKEVSSEPREQSIIANILSHLSEDPDVTNYRQDVFDDLKNLPDIREKISELFEKIEFNKQYGVIRKSKDEVEGLWFLMHRLNQYRDYITCVDALKECLGDERIKSQGLKDYRSYIDEVYADAHFNELKKDLEKLTKETSEIQSVTIGMNLNSRLEATSMGIVSVNNKPFKKSNIVSNFADGISGDKIKEGNEWNGDMHYRVVEKQGGQSFTGVMTEMIKATNPLVRSASSSTTTSIASGDGIANSPAQFDTVLNRMLDVMAKSLRRTLDKYSEMALSEVADVIPEFIYYIRFIDFLSKIESKGFKLTKPKAVPKGDVSMQAKGFYNFKLAMNLLTPKDLVVNDLVFDNDHTIYILTGANRGGKTTATQGIGLLYALAQGGVQVPADSFEFAPADCIYTHFPADEDQTMDLGRLGEECIRFKEIFTEATDSSLILMNETFSTTSFEEGYYIACDSIKALLTKGARTIYNTHMHKLGIDAEDFSKDFKKKASSLIVKSDGGKRSFKLAIAPPEGSSYAADIAKKYGVTYEMLTGKTE